MSAKLACKAGLLTCRACMCPVLHAVVVECLICACYCVPQNGGASVQSLDSRSGVQTLRQPLVLWCLLISQRGAVQLHRIVLHVWDSAFAFLASLLACSAAACYMCRDQLGPGTARDSSHTCISPLLIACLAAQRCMVCRLVCRD